VTVIPPPSGKPIEASMLLPGLTELISRTASPGGPFTPVDFSGDLAPIPLVVSIMVEIDTLSLMSTCPCAV
jgi:hypothetical protein